MERLGFDLCKGNGRFLPTQNGTADIAMDAALQTVANVQTPALFATYYSPEIVEILQAPRNSTEIFSEEKRGDWKDVQTMFPAVEYVGQTTAYSDYGRGLLSEANIEQVTRESYKFQTFIQIGDLEEDIATAQKINLLSEKQRAAATAIEIDANNYNLFGVAGMSIYGLLNDPALPAALSPATVDTKTAWADKDANAIYNDVLSMFNQIAEVVVAPVNIRRVLAGLSLKRHDWLVFCEFNKASARKRFVVRSSRRNVVVDIVSDHVNHAASEA